MKPTGAFYFALAVLIIIYSLVCYYIGLRGWQFLFRYSNLIDRRAYWTIFWVIALSYFAARIGAKILPSMLRYGMTVIGAYWLAAMFYLLQFVLILDLLRLLNRWLKFFPLAFQGGQQFTLVPGAVVLIATLGLLVFGSINAKNPQIRHYDVEIEKTAGSLKQLHLVAVSDIHLGEINHNGTLTRMVEMINDLGPDIVLLPGDIIDEDVGPFIKQNMQDTFLRLRPRYGVYAVPGNHEYIGGSIGNALALLEQAGITVLRDNSVLIDGSFFLIGRDDPSHSRFGGEAVEKSLAEILEGVDNSLPLILLNHQPIQLAEAQKEGIDLQLSGHTHRGQIFPINLITSRIFELDWGLLKRNDFHLIVSSGFGTWGPPIRVGNRPEIVDVMITFKS